MTGLMYYFLIYIVQSMKWCKKLFLCIGPLVNLYTLHQMKTEETQIPRLKQNMIQQVFAELSPRMLMKISQEQVACGPHNHYCRQ